MKLWRGITMALSTNIDKMNNMNTTNDKEGNHMAEKNIVFDTKELDLMVW